jgi:bifunctional NMN adenylyltransferase/nudix hydrolase
MEYDFLVYIGRFQPFHNGHKSVIDKALQLSRRVIVLIGSAGEPRTLRNPWTYEERESLIYAHYSLNNPFRGRIDLQPVVNRKYDHEWISMVKKAVDNVTWNYRTDSPRRLA